MTITTTVDTLPTPPSREDPANFASRANAFLSALATFSSQLNAFISETNATSDEVNGLKNQTESIYNLVLAAAGTTSKWTSGNAYSEGTLVFSPTNYQTYRRTASSPGSSTTDPASDATRWVQITSNTSGLLALAGNIEAGSGAATGSAYFELGKGRTGDGTSFIDLTSQTGADYNARIIRNTGANGSFDLVQTGAGNLQLTTVDASSIRFATSSTNRMILDNTGCLFLGTGVSGGPSGVGNVGFTQSGTNFVQSSTAISRFSNDTDSSYYVFSKSRGSSINTYTTVQSGDTLGRVQFNGADGTSMSLGAEIRAVVTGTPSVGNVKSSITFSVKTEAGSTIEVMRVSPYSGGTVLLGHSAHLTGLENYRHSIAGTGLGSSSAYLARFTADAEGPSVVLAKSRGTSIGAYNATLQNDVLGRIVFAVADGSSIRVGPEISAIAETAASSGLGNGGLRFYTRNAAGSQVETMRMTQAGDNVLVVRNNASPSTLDLNNTVQFTLTSNTNLRISARGSDGVTRVANITLA